MASISELRGQVTTARKQLQEKRQQTEQVQAKIDKQEKRLSAQRILRNLDRTGQIKRKIAIEKLGTSEEQVQEVLGQIKKQQVKVEESSQKVRAYEELEKNIRSSMEKKPGFLGGRYMENIKRDFSEAGLDPKKGVELYKDAIKSSMAYQVNRMKYEEPQKLKSLLLPGIEESLGRSLSEQERKELAITFDKGELTKMDDGSIRRIGEGLKYSFDLKKDFGDTGRNGKINVEIPEITQLGLDAKTLPGTISQSRTKDIKGNASSIINGFSVSTGVPVRDDRSIFNKIRGGVTDFVSDFSGGKDLAKETFDASPTIVSASEGPLTTINKPQQDFISGAVTKVRDISGKQAGLISAEGVLGVGGVREVAGKQVFRVEDIPNVVVSPERTVQVQDSIFSRGSIQVDPLTGQDILTREVKVEKTTVGDVLEAPTKFGRGAEIVGGTIVGSAFDLAGKKAIPSPKVIGSQIGDIARDPTIVKDFFRTSKPEAVIDLNTGFFREPSASDFVKAPAEERLPSNFLISKEGAVKATETTIGVGKFFVPVAGGIFFASEVEGSLREFKYDPIAFAKERPLEAGLIFGGGALVGGLKAAKFLTPTKAFREKKAFESAFERSKQIISEQELASSKLLKERQKTFERFGIADDNIQQEPFKFIGKGEKVTEKEFNILQEVSKEKILIEDTGKFTQETKIFPLSRKLDLVVGKAGDIPKTVILPELKFSPFLQEPQLVRTQLLLSSKKAGKTVLGEGVSSQIGSRGRPVGTELVTFVSKETEKGTETLFKTFGKPRKSTKIVKSEGVILKIEKEPFSKLKRQELVTSKILKTEKEGKVVKRVIESESKEIPTTPTSLNLPETIVETLEKPSKVKVPISKTSLSKELIVFTEPRTLMGGPAKAVKRRTTKEFKQFATELPSGTVLIDEAGTKILETSGKKSSQQFLQQLQQLPVPIVKPKPVLKPSSIKAPKTQLVEPSPEVGKLIESQFPSIVGGTKIDAGTKVRRPVAVQEFQTLEPLAFEGPTSQAMVPGLDTKPVLLTDTQVKTGIMQNIGLDVDTKVKTDVISKTSPALDVSPKVKVRVNEKIKVLEKVSQIALLKTKVKQRSVETFARATERVRPKPKPKPKEGVFKIKPPSLAKRILKKAEEQPDIFEVFATKAGEDISIGKAKTQTGAEELLRGKLKGTLRAGGFLTKAGQKIKARELKGFGGGEFRLSKVDPFKVIQKKEKRLGTRGETSEIQFFGGSRKSKKKPKGFF